jgi:hypothetical protein
MIVVAEHYGVQLKWRSYLEERIHTDWAEKCYNLLLLDNTLSREDHVWTSFVEGLHQRAAIVMCLMCSVFDLMDNFIEQGSLKRKNYKLAGVPHYKKLVMTPLQHLNEILDNCFDAPTLMKPFSVQVLFPKQNNSQIHRMITMLKDTSEWILNNKNLSAEKPISI